eukprot:746575-Hanusia_phi.AAC.3
MREKDGGGDQIRRRGSGRERHGGIGDGRRREGKEQALRTEAGYCRDHKDSRALGRQDEGREEERESQDESRRKKPRKRNGKERAHLQQYFCQQRAGREQHFHGSTPRDLEAAADVRL